MSLSMLEIILEQQRKLDRITLSEFTEAMQSGDRATKEEALDRMAEAGGYDNLED